MAPTTSPAPAGLLQHLLSFAFPAMTTEEMIALRDSVTQQGLLTPITLYDGQVLDGWHRYQIAVDLGYACPAVELAADLSPQEFVIGQNKVRRHITQAQMAMAVVEVHAWRPVGNPAFVQSETECPIGKTNAETALAAGVHPSTIKQAKIVRKTAQAEVIDAVKLRRIGLSKAAAIAKLPCDQQVAAIAAPLSKRPRAEQTSRSDLSPVKLAETQHVELAQYEVHDAQADVDADVGTLQKPLTTDEKLAALHAENSRLRAVLAATELARDDHMRRSNELMSQVEALRKKLEKLEAMDV
jgi:hypothetical protein